MKDKKEFVYICLSLLLIKELDSTPNNIYFSGGFHNIHHLTINSFSVQNSSTLNSTLIHPDSTNQNAVLNLVTDPYSLEEGYYDLTDTSRETGEYTLTKEEEYLVVYKGIGIDYSHNESLEDAPNKQFISAPGCPA